MLPIRASALSGAFLLLSISNLLSITPPTERRIKEISALLPDVPAAPGPVINDRKSWEAYAEHASAIVAEADQFLTEPIPELSDELYREFSRTGVRTGYQRLYGLRSYRLVTFTLAECATNQGKYLDALIAEMEAILSEKTWVLPAHDSSMKNFRGESISVDLGAAHRGGTLAVIASWLGDKLPDALREKTQAELNRRIFQPYLESIRAGAGPCGWVNGENNWNAVCNAGVVIAALSTVADRQTRAEMIAGAENSLLKYTEGYPNDGFCSEGIGYWNYGFGHYLLFCETVLRATQGKLNYYLNPKLPQIASFAERLALADRVLPSFGDVLVYPQPSAWISNLAAVRLYGKAIDTPLDPPGKATGPGPLGNSLYVNALLNFPPPSMPRFAQAQPEKPDPLRGWFPDAGVLVCRAPGSSFAAAFKGGAVEEGYSHHDHHDLGQFVVSYNNRTPLLDPGQEPYTARTFGPQRFESEFLNSFGHAVPLVAGKLQHGGVRAELVRSEFRLQEDIFILDLKPAYDVPNLRKLYRTFRFSREHEGSLTVSDHVEFHTPDSFGGALITYGSIEESSSGFLITDGPAALQVEIEAEPHQVQLSRRNLNVKLRRRPVRLGIDLAQPVTAATVTYRITPARLKVQPAQAEPQILSGELPEKTDVVRVEAESFTSESGGPATIVKRALCSGGTAVEQWAAPKQTLKWHNRFPEEGNYAIQLRYRSNDPLDTVVSIRVNESEGLEFLLPAATEPGANLKEWRETWICQGKSAASFQFRAGENEIKLVNRLGGDVALDWIQFAPLK